LEGGNSSFSLEFDKREGHLIIYKCSKELQNITYTEDGKYATSKNVKTNRSNNGKE